MLAEIQSLSEPCAAAESVGLRYVSVDEPGLKRLRAGQGFCYRDARGRRVCDRTVLDRVRRLAVPPAWREVWICADEDGHIQAVGYDERGRKQYRYHPRFREMRDDAKFDHLIAFAEALPSLRDRVDADMRAHGLGRDKVIATVVHLLETTMIRVGNTAYAKDNKSYGLTTLRASHVRVEGPALKFHFKGKSGREWRLGMRDRRVARVVRACQELPGQHLFQYLDDDGHRQSVTSADVNAYLREATGRDVTAKDFRTWAGTALAAVTLAEANDTPPTKKRLNAVIAEVAAKLGNTPTICRKCYIHPDVMNVYLAGELSLRGVAAVESGTGGAPRDLGAHETAVLNFLRRRKRIARRERSEHGHVSSSVTPTSGRSTS